MVRRAGKELHSADPTPRPDSTLAYCSTGELC